MNRNAALPPLLLDYAASTSPKPLNQGQTGSVTLTVTSPEPILYCDQILLSVKVGDDTDCLFQAAPAPSVTPPTWTAGTAEIVTGESLGLGTGSYATIKFSTDDPTAYAGYPLTLTLQGQIGTTPGAFPVVITESAGKTDDPQDFSTNKGQVQVTSATPVFYLESFVATAAAQGEDPCTEFQSGAAIYFDWDSNGDSYALWRKGETTAFWPGPGESGTAPPTQSFPAPATDTTYFLVATGTVDGTQTLYDSLTITIGNPDLTPNTVTAAGKVSAATLAVGGPAASGYAATVAGGLATDTLTSSGAAKIGTAAANADLTVNGAATVSGGMTVSGGLDSDTLTVSGSVAVIGTGGPCSAGQTYAAETDGFLCATIGPPPPLVRGSWPADQWSSITLAAWWPPNPGAPLVSIISGGCYSITVPGGFSFTFAPQSGMIPVAKGQSYSATLAVQFGAPTTSIWWVPFGTSS